MLIFHRQRNPPSFFLFLFALPLLLKRLLLHLFCYTVFLFKRRKRGRRLPPPPPQPEPPPSTSSGWRHRSHIRCYHCVLYHNARLNGQMNRRNFARHGFGVKTLCHYPSTWRTKKLQFFLNYKRGRKALFSSSSSPTSAAAGV